MKNLEKVNVLMLSYDLADYITGTNKLKKVSGGSDQFTYDYNGNVFTDFMFDTRDMIYDHRNLLIEFRKVVVEHGNDWTRYYYDDAGNRIRKYTIRSSSQEPPAPNWNNVGDDPNWWAVSNEYYYRDIAGNEIAIYESDQLKQWNVHGTDNVGKINSNDSLFFYLKDHLGSIKVVLDVDNTVVSCEDYDMWGYTFLGREFTEYPSVWERYKFTGKERDLESFYDYFGARYYMNVIGRWGSVDPLLEKHYDFSPYVYVLDNPLKFIDPEGMQVYMTGGEDWKAGQYKEKNETTEESLERYHTVRPRNTGRIESSEIQPADFIPMYALGRLSLFGFKALYLSIAKSSGRSITKEGAEIIGKLTLKGITKETGEYSFTKVSSSTRKATY